jgi:hypothetical protein
MQEMSDEYKAAQARLLLEQASDVDIIITTALIPGRRAPVLVTQEMLDAMKAGSVIVDLAAAGGGNVARTVPDEVITTANGVTIVGYTDLPSRLASTSSTLFGTNVANFILSVGPQTTRERGVYQIDLDDDAVQNMLVAYDGVRRYPDMITPYGPPPPRASSADAVAPPTDEEMRAGANGKRRAASARNAAAASVAACALLAFGCANDSGDGGVSLLATFALAGLAGYQVVWGVVPALHSPLMAVTNAMSGEFFILGGRMTMSDDDEKPSALICVCVAFPPSFFLLMVPRNRLCCRHVDHVHGGKKCARDDRRRGHATAGRGKRRLHLDRARFARALDGSHSHDPVLREHLWRLPDHREDAKPFPQGGGSQRFLRVLRRPRGLVGWRSGRVVPAEC